MEYLGWVKVHIQNKKLPFDKVVLNVCNEKNEQKSKEKCSVFKKVSTNFKFHILVHTKTSLLAFTTCFFCPMICPTVCFLGNPLTHSAVVLLGNSLFCGWLPDELEVNTLWVFLLLNYIHPLSSFSGLLHNECSNVLSASLFNST